MSSQSIPVYTSTPVVERTLVAEAPLSADTERKIRNIKSVLYRYNKAGKTEQAAFLRRVMETLSTTNGDYLRAGESWPAALPTPKDLPVEQRPVVAVRAGAGGPPPVAAEHDDEDLMERFRTAVTRLESLENDVEDLKEEIYMIKYRLRRSSRMA